MLIKANKNAQNTFNMKVLQIIRRKIQMKIEKTMLIGELIQMHELIPQMLMGAGMHCLGCPASQAESLEEACMVHGIDCDTLVSQMNPLSKRGRQGRALSTLR